MMCVTRLHLTCISSTCPSVAQPWWFFLPPLLSICVVKLPELLALCSQSGAPSDVGPRSLARLSWALIALFSLLILAISASMAPGEKSAICDTEEVGGRLARLGADLQVCCGGAGPVTEDEDRTVWNWNWWIWQDIKLRSDLNWALTWHLLPFMSLPRWGEEHGRGCTWSYWLGISFSSQRLLVNYNI